MCPPSQCSGAPVVALSGVSPPRTTVDRMPAPDPLHDLGVRAGADGGELRIWSEHATSVDLVVFDAGDLDWAAERTPLARDEHGVWQGTSAALVPGARYGLRID